MLDFTRKLTARSACTYLAWKLGDCRDPIILETRKGARFELRPNSFGNNDYGVAYEVMVHEYYQDHGRLKADAVRVGVDLGANVGYSMLYFLHAYPKCRLIAFEPHPRHAAQALRNLVIDGSRDRVEFYAKAAGASPCAMRITDEGSSSALVQSPKDGAIEVEVMDLFPILDGKRIDILKMDIEGGEYEILGDPRFERLDVAAVAMEWHSRGGGVADKRWCVDRLCSMGYEIREIFTGPWHGMFYASKVPGEDAPLACGRK